MTNSDFDFIQATLPAADLIYNLARRSTTGREEAEDLVQETYLRALKAWRAHRRPEKVEPWMATICLNIIRSDYRRDRRRPDEVLSAEPGRWQASDDNTEDAAFSHIQREQVNALIERLPEEQRTALTLVDLCGLTAAQAARITRSPRGTVLSRVHRGRKALAIMAKANKVKDHES